MAEATPAAIQTRRMRLAMGTFCTVQAAAASRPTVEAAIEAAFATVAKLEYSLHPDRAGSDVAAINTAVGGAIVAVAESTMRILQTAADVFAASDRIFDPCLPTRAGTFAAIELAGDHVVVRQDLYLDLGGIAKGFAADESLAQLRRHGCTDGSVNIGGDIVAFGARELLALRRADGSLMEFDLDNAAVAVTSVDPGSQPPEHRGYYQRTSDRPRIRDYAAVIAPSAAIADALTKCALYCERARLPTLLNRFAARLL
jgi:thiamine biosynthesis lipoprotein